MNLSQIPYVRLVFPFLLGIVAAIQLSFNQEVAFIAFLIFSFLAIGSLFWPKIDTNYHFRWFFGSSITLALFFAAVTFTTHRVDTIRYDLPAEQKTKFIGWLIEPLSEKERSYKSVIQIESYYDSAGWHQAEGRAVIYFEKDSIMPDLRYGDRIVFQGIMNEIENAENPYEFDYKRYMANQGILLQTYAGAEKWKLLQREQGWFVLDFAHNLRQNLLQKYRQYGLKGDEFAIAAALTLGYKNDLDRDTRQAFSVSGAMHVLAVSGLHVGIIFLIIDKLLFFFNQRLRILRFLRVVIIIASLWLFALITGLSPSVNRAALMLTFVAIGQSLNRRISIYNSLALSAFFLLLVNPLNLVKVGFQLSYFAVFAIVFFQPRIHRLIYIPNRQLDKIWSLLSVSIAAQIGTLPISLYYFHQFPVYFWLTNIFVIPMAFFIVYFGVAVSLLSFWDPVAAFVANGLIWLVKALNYIVRFIEQLPFSAITDIPFSLMQLFILYLIFTIFTLFVIFRRRLYFWSGVGLLLLFASLYSYQKTTAWQKQMFWVYNVRGGAVYNWISPVKNTIIVDSAIVAEPQQLTYAATANWLKHYTQPPQRVVLELLTRDTLTLASHSFLFKNQFLKLGNQSFYLCRNAEMIKSYYSEQLLQVDYCILSGNISVKIDELLEVFDVGKIIIDSSNSYWKAHRWAQDCQAAGQPYYWVGEQGAFGVDVLSGEELSF